MQAMRERDDGQPLSGSVQVDDVFWGGECRGKKRGRGAPARVEKTEFTWINTMIGSVKTALHGSYGALGGRHVGRYLGAFYFRVNRRFELDWMIERLAFVARRTASLPYKFATMDGIHT